jgi:Ca-activated chloride channel homolog
MTGKIPSVDPLKYQGSGKSYVPAGYGYRNEYLTIKIRYKKPDGITSMLMEKPVKNYVNDMEETSENLRFAAAVSEFGMILRNSEFRGSSSLEEAIRLAKSARGEDEEGYRSEFIRLIDTVKGLRVLADKEF